MRTPGGRIRGWKALALLGGMLGSAGPAAALSVFTLDLAPSSSVGGEPLAGSLTVAIGTLPLAGNTTLQLTDVAATAGGGSFSLDPSIPTAGLGVAHADGSFLIPTLFLRVDVGTGPLDLAIPNVTGTLELSNGGLTLTRLETAFDVDAGDPPESIPVRVVATPEPVAAWLVGLGLLLLSLGRAVPEISR